jgi:hypothetical protein
MAFKYEARKQAHQLQKKLSRRELVQLLCDIIPTYQRTTIVLDALDECKYFDVLLLFLRDLFKSSGGKLRMILSSRLHVTAPVSFPSHEEILIQHGVNETDIKKFVQTQVLDRESLNIGKRLLNGRYKDLELRLIDLVTHRAQGM